MAEMTNNEVIQAVRWGTEIQEMPGKKLVLQFDKLSKVKSPALKAILVAMLKTEIDRRIMGGPALRQGK